jgi:hypothetical protein
MIYHREEREGKWKMESRKWKVERGSRSADLSLRDSKVGVMYE